MFEPKKKINKTTPPPKTTTAKTQKSLAHQEDAVKPALRMLSCECAEQNSLHEYPAAEWGQGQNIKCQTSCEGINL